MTVQEEAPVSRAAAWIARVCAACARRAWLAVAIALALGGAASMYAATHMAMDTDTGELLSADLPWRQREVAFDRAFPQRVDLIAIVVDGATAELAERSTAALAARLAQQHALLRSVRRPDGGPFFEREGLLFAPLAEVNETTSRLIAAQPMLATLAADPSLRGIMETVHLMLEGARRDPGAFTALAQPLATLTGAFESALSGAGPPFSWRAMLAGGKPDPRELRRFILVQPILAYDELQPGAKATGLIRQAVRDLGLAANPSVRVRLTGPVPLADEELATLAQGAGVDAALMLTGMIALLWLALGSASMVVAVLVSVVVGLAITTAFGLMVFGRLNLISVAFAVLFVGLGVDFGIQFCVAYRTKRRLADHLVLAVRRAGGEIGGALALAALSTALGFYAFVPTDYRGVSELGVIAGTGMLIAFVVSVTFLPALLVVLRAPPETGSVGYARLAVLDDWIGRRRVAILGLGLLIGIASLALVPRLRFDFNPLNLKSSSAESVATILDLSADPATTPNTIDVLAPSLAEAVAASQRLAALPEVDHAITLASFVPEEQEQKLALIQDAALLLDPVLHPAAKTAPEDAEVVQALGRAAQALDQARGAAPPAVAASMLRLASALRQLAQGDQPQRERAAAALVPGLVTTLGQVSALLEAQPVTVQTLPSDLMADWVSRDGRARVEVFPKGDGNDNATLVRFLAAVREVAPDATGAPVSIQESSRTIVRAFVEAGVWALVATIALLALVLRHVPSVLLTLAPLLLAGLVTLAVCALTGFALNFENIIALPLLFGIGVAFDIYFIMAWRAGRLHLLASSLTRAVLFSALTTGTAFGSLALSHHPGTASMGALLALSLLTTLAAVLVFLPALLRSVPFRR